MEDNIHNQEDLISKYLAGEMTPEEKQSFFLWMESDKTNRYHFALLKNIWDAAHTPFSADEINPQQAYTRLKLQQEPGRRKRSLLQWCSRGAAILFLPLLITSAFLFLKQGSSDNTVYQEVVAPYGTYSSLELPDGSKVSFNAGSKLKYPVPFQKGNRNVYLDGEAYFEVASNQDNPFTVHTDKIVVQATGTIFQVEDYTSDTIAAVTMVEGKVHTTIGNYPSVAMKEKERIVYSKTTNTYEQKLIDPYKWYAWKDGALVFRDDPLEYVFKRISQTFNVEIAIRDERLSKQLYKATFRQESLEEILRLLELSAAIRYKEVERISQDNEYQSRRLIEVYSVN